jgi:hypothetical protein
MGVVAMYSMLLDGRCTRLILRNPPQSQDVISNPDGRGPATEILNCLRITDLWQLPALLSPAEVVLVGDMPESYLWSDEVLKKLGKKTITVIDKL